MAGGSGAPRSTCCEQFLGEGAGEAAWREAGRSEGRTGPGLNVALCMVRAAGRDAGATLMWRLTGLGQRGWEGSCVEVGRVEI